MKRWLVAAMAVAMMYAVADVLARLAFRIDNLEWRVKLLERGS